MSEFLDEQKDEIEALESIYSEEIDFLGDSPHCFTIPVKTEDYNEDEGEGRLVLFKFTFTEKYPSEEPLLEVEESENIDDEHLEELNTYLHDMLTENLGMPMVFTIVSAAIEWLGDKNDQIKEEMETAAKKKLEMEEEEERRKLEGTRVTVESFLAWKAEFDQERLEKMKTAKVKSNKLTGRELFMQDKTLNDSDIKFLETTGDTAVTVDESLFEDLDDLDLDDESDEDPDWKPGDDSD
eukprot:TRINITY_DN1036_c0_g1_i4.p1 TRINITY_DN1036_c0_g1~~TRINITY_DN1036_c0_g1_i4.p1  ORF type:complete len:239 (+),score=82.21 TRINITY_DN1036_c0_g1_i4:54-770(+)